MRGGMGVTEGAEDDTGTTEVTGELATDAGRAGDMVDLPLVLLLLLLVLHVLLFTDFGTSKLLFAGTGLGGMASDLDGDLPISAGDGLLGVSIGLCLGLENKGSGLS